MLQDPRYALRSFARNPGFVAAAVVCLALAALGATPRDIVRLVLRQTTGVVVVGLVVGVGTALGLTRLMTTLLYNVPATDPLTFASLTVFLAIVALLASYLPARRATRVDPIIALRNE